MNEFEKQGYMPWTDHPGYTIEYMNKMLEPHNLKIVTVEEKCPLTLWFKVVPINEQ